ncbi:hypothetical protein Taro_010419 [Colocasia esculenta]|uniref:AP2/ERF domain-containing protein n=1 Tax=Colocasia esculenta TaxID=4460 RepID=A0A843U393_COLES|nr:hypothetical protein [Colocasia esculenta]
MHASRSQLGNSAVGVIHTTLQPASGTSPVDMSTPLLNMASAPYSGGPAMAAADGSGDPEGIHYKGVWKRKWGKWVAEVRLPNSRERIWLGSYGTAQEAARAYDAAVFCLRGPGAKFNFPGSPPNIPFAETLSRVQIREVAARYAREPAHAETPERPLPSVCADVPPAGMDEQTAAFLREVNGEGWGFSEVYLWEALQGLHGPEPFFPAVRVGRGDQVVCDGEEIGGDAAAMEVGVATCTGYSRCQAFSSCTYEM